MIKEIVIENITIGEETDESNKIVGPDSRGKILKVFVRFSDNDRSDARLKIITKEGEQILNIDSNEKRGIYYPRVSIESGKYGEDAFGTAKTDYFYFLNGLLVSVKMDNPGFEGRIIDKIRIIYED